jgi:hypothetical protein
MKRLRRSDTETNIISSGYFGGLLHAYVVSRDVVLSRQS